MNLPRINYVYCTDTILDRDKPETQNLTNQSLQRLAEERGANNQSERRPEGGNGERRQPLNNRGRGIEEERGQIGAG